MGLFKGRMARGGRVGFKALPLDSLFLGREAQLFILGLTLYEIY